MKTKTHTPYIKCLNLLSYYISQQFIDFNMVMSEWFYQKKCTFLYLLHISEITFHVPDFKSFNHGKYILWLINANVCVNNNLLNDLVDCYQQYKVL